MSYQVLARKWRPQSFANVVGQEHVLTALANGLAMGRIHHAYLFSGTRGVGKTSIARLLAKGLNCESGITATPCGKCANCQEIEKGRFVDLLEIDAASRTKVEDTRELLDNVQYAPARGRFKVYLIDEVHMLSRHSFNALLKTLEEPPEHVKFLLATTDPQKLPVTILSRCLQFHLKALDVDQINHQLAHILAAEGVPAQPRALTLLARAAQGSLRDALSLADQAIALGNGEIAVDTVSVMLGTLDDECALALVEALSDANAEALMSLVEQTASKGIDWETLLVEMLAVLHQIAMIQLLPAAIDATQRSEQRLRELARRISPQDIQLYYQTLLVGRKELAYAPDRRMGVEMTLLRALAFHPKKTVTLPDETPSTEEPAVSVVPSMTVNERFNLLSEQAPIQQHAQPNKPHASTRMPSSTLAEPTPSTNTIPVTDGMSGLSASTAQMLQARNQLRQQQGVSEEKKTAPAKPSRATPPASVLARFATATEQKTAAPAAKPVQPDAKKERYRWKAQSGANVVKPPVATPNALRSALSHEKTPELAAKLAEESLHRDAWAAEIAQMSLPKLVQQLALNAFKEQVSETEVRLHLRSSQRHLNGEAAQNVLAEAMRQRTGQAINLTIIEDDDPAIKTPLEWRQAIYEEKLAQAKASVIADNNIQTLCRYFEAELDEDSIRPV